MDRPVANEDLTSSLYAIHRPIAARRRKIQGAVDGEIAEEGEYVVKGREEEHRKERLAGKLADIFGLEAEEDVVAGPFLFPFLVASR